MLECINKECGQYESGICPNKCDDRIKPTHTPTYAEEQLNHAIEKENNISADTPIDYEEEYHKLKKENEEKKELINKLQESKSHTRDELEKALKENDSLKLKAAVIEKLEIEINNLNAIIDSKDDRISDLQVSHNVIEQENNQLKFNVEELGQMVDEGEEEIKQLKTRIENRQVAIKSLSEGKQKLNEAIEIKDNIIDETMKQNEKLKATIKVLASLL